MVPIIFAPYAALLLAQAQARAGERVLDVACGTGIVTRLVTERVGVNGMVAGLDGSPAMLAVARREAAGRPITWRETDATALPFADGSFDFVLCQQGMQFFPDRAGALREM